MKCRLRGSRPGGLKLWRRWSRTAQLGSIEAPWFSLGRTTPPTAPQRGNGTGSISTEQAFELLDLIERLVSYLRTGTYDEEPGESDIGARAKAALARYRPAVERMSSTATRTTAASE